jgi:dTDP-4-amino-4,6-dideoxygalactose transaminase
MIRMNDFRAEPEALREAMRRAVARVIDSGWYVLGNECVAFEKQWAGACGTGFGVGVGNGMDAIEIGLRTLGVGAGDEVITTPMTAFATALAIHRAGARPVFADIDPHTALMSRESAARCLSPKTKAVVLVHLYGQLRDMDDWVRFCAAHRLFLIEDCAQAHSAKLGGRTAGSFGALGAYSFYPTKNLGALGDAGMLVTDDADLARRAARLRNYGQSERYHHPDMGLNSRLDEIQAALLQARTAWLGEFTERRRRIATRYRTEVRHAALVQLAPATEPAAHVHHLFVLTCERRDQLQAHLESRGVQALIHYPVPAHRQAPMAAMPTDPLGLPHSERHAATCLSLPCHPQMSEADVTAVIEALNSFDRA